MRITVVFVYALVARFPPVKDVLDDVEDIFHLAPDAGLALLEFLFVLSRQTIAIVPLERASLTIDPVFAFYAVCHISIHFQITGIAVNHGIVRTEQSGRNLALDLVCCGYSRRPCAQIHAPDQLRRAHVSRSTICCSF